MNKGEKKQPIELFCIGAFIVIFFAALFFAFPIYDYGVENQGISLDYHFDNIVEGDYFSFSIFARDGISYDWDNYEIVFDGFTAEEYVYESKYDDYKSFFFSNITDTGGE